MGTAATKFIEDGLSALARAVRDHDGELRNIQLATVSPNGKPDVRTLVLRAFDREPARAEIHSDWRADKVRDIGHENRVALLAWSSADHLQLRFEGVADCHRGDDLARVRWNALSPRSRKAYGLEAASGSPIADPDCLPYLPPDDQERQFTVVMVSLASVDVLRLGDDGGQTRARGRFTPSGLEADWVAP